YRDESSLLAAGDADLRVSTRPAAPGTAKPGNVHYPRVMPPPPSGWPPRKACLPTSALSPLADPLREKRSARWQATLRTPSATWVSRAESHGRDQGERHPAESLHRGGSPAPSDGAGILFVSCRH